MGPSLRTRSGRITKSYRELGVEDPEENFVTVLPKAFPDLIGRRETLPNPTGKKKAIIMRIKGGSAVEISTLQEAAL